VGGLELRVSVRSDIENVLYRYAWSYDMDELDRMGECFTEDAEVSFGTGLQVGRAAVVQELARRRDKYRPEQQVPWHVISNVLIEDQSERQATVKSFFTFFVKPATGPAAFSSIGYYDDTFVYDGAAWRISRRRVMSAGER
jgi:3-phenylpropionate/cinnamic acid dioxygenase small subunit